MRFLFYSTLEFDRKKSLQHLNLIGKKHFKFFEIFENHRILDFKQLNLIEKITSNFEKFEKFEVLMRTLIQINSDERSSERQNDVDSRASPD